MKKSELQDSIMRILSKTTIREGDTLLSELVNKIELLEIAKNLVINLPPYPDSLVEELDYQVLRTYTPIEKEIVYSQSIKDLFRLYLLKLQTKEQMALLIFYLILDFKEYFKTSFTNELLDVKPYLFSYIIQTDKQLREEIAFNNEEGRTRPLGDNYIRLRSDLKLIPTIETLLKFTRYLYKIR